MDKIGDLGIINSASSLFRPRQLAAMRVGGVFLLACGVPSPERLFMWQIQDDFVSLHHARLAAQIPLADLQRGAVFAPVATHGWLPCQVFQLTLDAATATIPCASVESLVRGDSLIVRYRIGEESSASLDLRLDWRYMVDEDSEAVGIELLVALQTRELQFQPTLAAKTVVASNCVHVAETSSASLRQLDAAALDNEQIGTGLRVFDLINTPYCLIELSGTADWTAESLRRPNDQTVVSGHSLFGEVLEKGVIRRTRLQALIAPRTVVQQAAWRCYQRFTKAPLPLMG